MRFLLSIIVISILSGCAATDDRVGLGPVTLSEPATASFYDDYLQRRHPRYFVLSSDGQHADPVTCAGGSDCDAGALLYDALLRCAQRAGQNCFVFAHDRSIVWDGLVVFADATVAATPPVPQSR